jgi:hypothetical protein
VGGVTIAILVRSARELATVTAALLGGQLQADSCWLLVASPEDAAELDHALLDAARVLGGEFDLAVAHLNEVIQPWHPHDWRLADLDRAAFLSGCGRAGAPGEPTRVGYVGELDGAARVLVRLLQLEPVAFADSPESVAGLVVSRRRDALVVGLSPGLGAAAAVFGVHWRPIPWRAVRSAEDRLARFGPDGAGEGPCAALEWWLRFLRSVGGAMARALTWRWSRARPAAAGSQTVPEPTLAFVEAMIADIDAERAGVGVDAGALAAS